MEEKELGGLFDQDVLDIQENLEGKIEEMGKKLKESEDKYARLFADFENVKKRHTKEKVEIWEVVKMDILKKFINVFDDFGRALSVENFEEGDVFHEGLKMIFDKFERTFEDLGLKEIEVKEGDNMNIDLHEIISTKKVEDDKVDKVVAVAEKGYKLNEKVLRFAKVIIGER